MAKKATPKVATEEAAPAPVFTPCAQCSYPADCARAAKCRKGFK